MRTRPFDTVSVEIKSLDLTIEDNPYERQINIVNFNCKNVNSNYFYVYELLRSNDILFLCETWHYEGEKIIKEFESKAKTHFKTAMENKIKGGRPYGGIG